MINILFIAFEFPPLNRGGVHRPLAFVRYLPENGINPIVITLDNACYKDVFDSFGYDEGLGKEVISKTTMVPVPADKAPAYSRIKQFTSIYFSIHGNETKYWEQHFYNAVEKAIAAYKPKAIFATVPPFSLLPLVDSISKKYKIPVVLDFRDAWSQWRTLPYGTIMHYWRTLQFEKKYLKNAKAIVATSKQTLDDFKSLHPQVPANKFHYIPNGYNGALQTWQPVVPDKDEWTIGYVGSFYFTPDAREQMLKPWYKKRGHRMLQYIPQKQDWQYRSPYFFFQALQQLNAESPDLGKKIKVKFAGKKPAWLIEMIKSFGLEQQVTLIGEVSHEESLRFQQQCDALLITSAKQLGGRDYSIAGKTFEYLQMQRPIIAFVCDGAQKDLLSDAGTALICDPDRSAEAVKQMRQLFEGKLLLQPDYKFLKSLSRETLTAQLANVIRNIS